MGPKRERERERARARDLRPGHERLSPHGLLVWATVHIDVYSCTGCKHTRTSVPADRGAEHFASIACRKVTVDPQTAGQKKEKGETSHHIPPRSHIPPCTPDITPSTPSTLSSHHTTPPTSVTMSHNGRSCHTSAGFAGKSQSMTASTNRPEVAHGDPTVHRF